MKLLGYILNGQTIGVNKTSWNTDELNGNNPFTVIDDNDVIPNNYSDISSIVTWGDYGLIDGMKFSQVREEIRKLKPNDISVLSEDELRVINEYGLNKYYLIYDSLSSYTPYEFDATVPPFNYDYDIIGLHKKRYFNKGELGKVEYYTTYNPLTSEYSGLCVVENRVYHRYNRMINRREMDITWYYNDGTSGETKHTIKYYTTEEAIQAGETRRRNVISTLKTNTVGLIMMTSGLTQTQAENLGLLFLEQYNNAIFKYIEGVESVLKNIILTDTNHSWLNNVIPNTCGITIRLYLYD